MTGPFFAAVEIPEVAVVDRAERDALGGVHDRAAADGKDEVHLFLAGQVDALVNQVAQRAGLDAAQFDIVDAFLFKGSFYAVEQAGTLGRAAAVVDQDLGAAVLLYVCAGLIFGAPYRMQNKWGCKK